MRTDAAYLNALEATVETPPREQGLGFDVWTSERFRRVPGGAGRGEDSAGLLAAGAARPAALSLRASQAHAGAPAEPGGGGHLRDRA